MAKLTRIDNHPKILKDKRNMRYKMLFMNAIRCLEFLFLCFLVYKAI